MSYPSQTSGLGVAARITLNVESVQISYGGSFQLVATATDLAGNPISATLEYASNNPSVVVDADGLLTAPVPDRDMANWESCNYRRNLRSFRSLKRRLHQQ